MRSHHQKVSAAALLALAAALALGARLLTAGADAPSPAPAAAAGSSAALQSVAGEVTPLPDIRPSEELPADAAVAFPTDI